MSSKIEDFFGDWGGVVDFTVTESVLQSLLPEYANKMISPSKDLIFKAFTECAYKDLKVVIIGQDPYPQKDIATGIAFGVNGELSPSLEVLFEVLQRTNKPVILDKTLVSWANQGVLLLNSALTVEINKIGSHTMIWRKFIVKLLENLSEINSGIIYVLLGSQAKTFRPFINKNSNHILEYNHPAFYARIDKPMEGDLFKDVNDILKRIHNSKIKFYGEI